MKDNNTVYDFKVYISIPRENSVWKADIQERKLTAHDLNEVLITGITPDEIKKGARITSIWRKKTLESFYSPVNI